MGKNVYILTYLPTGRKYVGKTGDNDGGRKRFRYHLYQLQHGEHSSKQFQTDYDRYGGGAENFEMKYIEKALVIGMWEARLFDTEKLWMFKLKTYNDRYGYNSQDPSMRRWLRKCRMYTAIAT